MAADSNGVGLATKTGMFMSQRVQSERGGYQGFDVAFEPQVLYKRVRSIL